MSRCFPFPPPGYKRGCSEALVESIKLQKGREESKEERKKDKIKNKEKRKDKKDKKDKKDRKERKEKEGKATLDREGEGKVSKHNKIESYNPEKVRAEPGSGCLRKDEENEQLERSGITEEHDQPFSSNEPCCLSDSTQSSNKRKRSSSSSSNDHGTIFKIRLPVRKHRETEVVQVEPQLPSTSGCRGTSDSLANEAHQLSHCPGNTDSKNSTELQDLVQASVRVDDHKTNFVDEGSQRMTSLYDSLFQNLNSCPPHWDGSKLKDDDEDWWLSSKPREESVPSKKAKSVCDPLRCSGPTLWPRSQYLPEADIYALPYAIPF